eukprot:GHVS01107504.1.p1 GENE.GHVS01107504.1~~GHVS01107504.1.p1  ORF type:complete len:270 (-),score=79.22 GHVS01107504.1:67-876(-)
MMKAVSPPLAYRRTSSFLWRLQPVFSTRSIVSSPTPSAAAHRYTSICSTSSSIPSVFPTTTTTSTHSFFSSRFFLSLPSSPSCCSGVSPSSSSSSSARRLFSSSSFRSDEVYLNTVLAARIDRLTTCLLASSFSDYWSLVLNVPFWEEEKNQIDRHAVPFLADRLVAPKYQSLLELFDLLYVLEDSRDHLNEILDYASRTGGVGGTGAYAHPDIHNIDEHVDALTAVYEQLKKKYPHRLPDIEDVLGVGLALLRQKHKFRWTTMHEYSY